MSEQLSEKKRISNGLSIHSSLPSNNAKHMASHSEELQKTKNKKHSILTVPAKTLYNQVGNVRHCVSNPRK